MHAGWDSDDSDDAPPAAPPGSQDIPMADEPPASPTRGGDSTTTDHLQGAEHGPEEQTSPLAAPRTAAPAAPAVSSCVPRARRTQLTEEPGRKLGFHQGI